MTATDLDDLISSTLSALDNGKKAEEVMAPPSVAARASEHPVEELNDVDECLKKLDTAAPKVVSAPESSDEGLGHLIDTLLTPETILDSMQSLSDEMDKFLSGNPELNHDELRKHTRQSQIYKEVAKIYSDSPNVTDEDTSPEGVRLRSLLSELQDLGQPPKQVIESLMVSQLSEGGDSDANSSDLVREFQQFMTQASGNDGPSLPGLTKEDEEILKQLTSDPNAMKDLLSSMGNKDGDCCIS